MFDVCSLDKFQDCFKVIRKRTSATTKCIRTSMSKSCGRISAKRSVVELEVLNKANESIQQMINQDKSNRSSLQKDQNKIIHLQNTIDTLKIEEMNLNNNIDSLNKTLQDYEEDIETKNEDIDKLKEEIEDLKVNKIKLTQDVIESDKMYEGLQYMVGKLEGENTDFKTELKNTKVLIEHSKRKIKELKKTIQDLTREKNKLREEFICAKNKSAEILLSKSESFEQLNSEVESMRQELASKTKCFDEIQAKYDEIQTTLQTEKKSSCTDLEYIRNENEKLKLKLVQYKKSIIDLKRAFTVKEDEFQDRIFLLENNLELQNKLREYEINKDKNDFKRFDNGGHDYIIDEFISNAKDDVKNRLQNMADSAKYRETLMRELKSKNYTSRFQNLNFYKINKEIKARKSNPFYMKDNIVEKDHTPQKSVDQVRNLGNNKDTISNLEKELKESKKENESLSKEISLCKSENTKLVDRLNEYQKKLVTLEDALKEKLTTKEENKKLKDLITQYEIKVKERDSKLEDADKIKLQRDDLQLKIEFYENEKKINDKTCSQVQNELKFLRSTTRMMTGGCCMELKVEKEHLINKVDFLEKQAAQFKKEISSLQKDKNNTNEIQYNEMKKLFEKSEKENLRWRMEKNQENQRRSTNDSANVNVHVHLDKECTSSNGEDEGSKLREYTKKIKKLTMEKDRLQNEISESESRNGMVTEELEHLHDLFEEKQNEWKEKEKEWQQHREKNEEELRILREQLHSFSSDGKTDIDMLRSKIHDLSAKQEGKEGLIERLKEDKADLQMKVDMLERQLSNTQRELQFKDTERAEKRRRAEASTGQQNHKPTYPMWLDSTVNNKRDFANKSDSLTPTNTREKSLSSDSFPKNNCTNSFDEHNLRVEYPQHIPTASQQTTTSQHSTTLATNDTSRKMATPTKSVVGFLDDYQNYTPGSVQPKSLIDKSFNKRLEFSQHKPHAIKPKRLSSDGNVTPSDYLPPKKKRPPRDRSHLNI